MDNISLYTQINSLPSDLKKQVEEFVALLSTKRQGSKNPEAEREFGILKGKLALSKDFDAPLEDFKEYM